MLSSIHLTNLWVFYVLVYVIAFPLRQLANKRRGEPIEDPEMLRQHKLLSALTFLWLFGGLAISLFVPLSSGILFYIGLVFYIVGMIIVASSLIALGEPGLVRGRVYRYSRNPNYVGMVFVIFGLNADGVVYFAGEHSIHHILLPDNPVFPLDNPNRGSVPVSEIWRFLPRLSTQYGALL